LNYGGDSAGRELDGYADADGMSLANRKAISGYAFLVDSGAVSFRNYSPQLPVPSLSTTITNMHWHLFMQNSVNSTPAPRTSIFVITSFAMLSNAIQNGSIRLVYCPTDEMHADTLTKALPNAKAKHFAHGLELIPA
jgi:hypothetical protein